MPKEKEQQSFDELKARYEKLNQQKIVYQTKRDTVREQLEELRETAKEQFGTDDVDELKQKLGELKSENEKKRQSYQDSLDQIETRLAEIENEFEQAEVAASE